MPECLVFFTLLNSQNVTIAIEQIEALVSESNKAWHRRVEEWMHQALENVRGTIRYYKIEQGRPEISESNALVDPYFSVLTNEKQSKVVHNGWIANASPDVDFATEVNFNYLKREINIWGDSIKLRYGRRPADSPYLWQHMSEYVTSMASIFDGFRLDNAHSTPIHVV